jgi:hypothetical protein
MDVIAIIIALVIGGTGCFIITGIVYSALATMYAGYCVAEETLKERRTSK